jgi:predicted HAD superfamily Cof-like phosphohydrolase
MTLENAGYHRAVAAELDRQRRAGYTPEHDDTQPLDHLLELAFRYISEGKTVKGGAMIIAARGWLQRHTKNSMQTDIEEFMRRCDQAVADYPQLPSDEIVTLRIRLMVEELLGAVNPYWVALDEFGEEKPVNANRYIELLVKNKSDELVASMLRGDLVGVADGLADVLYVVIGTAVAYGIDIQEVFDEVHRSNLSKTVWNEEEGRYTIEKDEFGKGVKPPTYSPAELEPIVLRQITAGKEREAYLAEAAESDDEDASVVVGTIDL